MFIRVGRVAVKSLDKNLFENFALFKQVYNVNPRKFILTTCSPKS